MSYYDGTNEVEYVKSFERSAVSTVLKNVYLWMTAALAISGLTAMVVAESPAILNLIFANSFTMCGTGRSYKQCSLRLFCTNFHILSRIVQEIHHFNQ